MHLKLALEDFGYEVVGPASDGAEATVFADKCEPDAIVMDVGLRGAIDGIQTAEAIQGKRRTRILFLSGDSGLKNRSLAVPGVTRFVTKPARIDAVLTELAALLDADLATEEGGV